MRRELRRGIGNMDNRRGGIAKTPIAQTKIQRRADHDDQVCPAEGRPTSAGDQERMFGRQDAPRHSVGDGRDAGRIDECPGRAFGAVGPHISTQDEDGTLSTAQQIDDAIEVGGVRGKQRQGICRWRGGGARCEENIHGYVNERWPTMCGTGDTESLVDRWAYAGRIVHRHRGLRHRGHQRHMIHLLQRPRTPAPIWCPTTDEDQR